MIYVDDMLMPAQVGNVTGKWSHLFCWPPTPENVERLHAFAARIGMQRSWFQNRDGFPHYDVLERKRRLAIIAGAKVVHYPGGVVEVMRMNEVTQET